MSAAAAASSSSSSSQSLDDIDELTPQQLQQVAVAYQQMRAELTQIAQKVAELEGERKEHQSVIDAISKLDASRKCFRLIGGVLVERNVGEVLPAVQKNADGISATIQQIAEMMKKKEANVQDFIAKYGRFLSQAQMKQQQQQSKDVDPKAEAKSTGVLV